MVSSYLYGPLTRLGLIVAVLVAIADQALKLWLVFVFELGRRGRVALGPYVDLVLSWNTGISYGLFREQGMLGQDILFAVKIVAVALLWVWLARAGSRLSARGARADHWRRHRQRDRSAYVRRSGGFCPGAHHHPDVAVRLVCLQPGRRRDRGRGHRAPVRLIGRRPGCRKSALIFRDCDVGSGVSSSQLQI